MKSELQRAARGRRLYLFTFRVNGNPDDVLTVTACNREQARFMTADARERLGLRLRLQRVVKPLRTQ